MFDRASVGVARVAPDGRFLVVNPGLCRMLGHTRTQLLSKTCEEITHPYDREKAAALVKKILAGEEASYRIEKRCLHRTGSPLWVLETSSAVADHNGCIAYRVCLIQVNERKLAEEHFRSAVEAATSSMVMVNHKRKIVLVNSRSEQLFGYSSDELLGKPIDVVLARSFGKSDQHFLAELMTRPEALAKRTKWDVYGRRRNGELFPAELGLNPVHTQKGMWILTSVVDMSERKWSDENVQATVTLPVVGIDSVARDIASQESSASVGDSRTEW
jgi:PAS domain S-box-containing protein